MWIYRIPRPDATCAGSPARNEWDSPASTGCRDPSSNDAATPAQSTSSVNRLQFAHVEHHNASVSFRDDCIPQNRDRRSTNQASAAPYDYYVFRSFYIDVQHDGFLDVLPL